MSYNAGALGGDTSAGRKVSTRLRLSKGDAWMTCTGKTRAAEHKGNETRLCFHISKTDGGFTSRGSQATLAAK